MAAKYERETINRAVRAYLQAFFREGRIREIYQGMADIAEAAFPPEGPITNDHEIRSRVHATINSYERETGFLHFERRKPGPHELPDAYRLHPSVDFGYFLDGRNIRLLPGEEKGDWIPAGEILGWLSPSE